MALTKCPKCGYKRFDTWAGACERRQCGYEVAVADPCEYCGRTDGSHEDGMHLDAGHDPEARRD